MKTQKSNQQTITYHFDFWGGVGLYSALKKKKTLPTGSQAHAKKENKTWIIVIPSDIDIKMKLEPGGF